MSGSSELAPVVVPADGGDTVFLVGDTYTTLLSGEQTGGAFTLLEAIVPPQTGPPPHAHQREDETFVMLDGEIEFHLGDAVHEARAGTVLFVPKGVVHHFRNTGASAAKMLFLYNPAGMDGMFAEIGAPGVRGEVGPPLSEADVAAMIAVSAKYHFTIAPPPGA